MLTIEQKTRLVTALKGHEIVFVAKFLAEAPNRLYTRGEVVAFAVDEILRRIDHHMKTPDAPFEDRPPVGGDLLAEANQIALALTHARVDPWAIIYAASTSIVGKVVT